MMAAMSTSNITDMTIVAMLRKRKGSLCHCDIDMEVRSEEEGVCRRM